MFELKVNASKKYFITVADDLSAFVEKTEKFVVGENVAVITDDTVDKIYGNILYDYFPTKKLVKIVIRHGEKSKNATNYIRIINALAEHGFTREDTVIAFGGGVVGDIAAFAASTYMRGINLIALPTTLLSMIDSSVGGKTAIDLKYGKNLCGTFYQPSAVYIDTEFLKTLPEKEIKNGLGELTKYALLSNTVTVKDIIKPTKSTIYRCLKIKRDIVDCDERENGVRALLNLGHTVGHAIEKLSGYKIPHGVAVAKGVKFTIEVSKRLYGLPDNTVKDAYEILNAAKINTDCKFSASEITGSVYADKKRRGEEVSFIAIKSVGQPFIEKIKVEKLGEILQDIEKGKSNANDN